MTKDLIEILAKNLIKIKQEFARTYDGNSHIQEILPSKSNEFKINPKHLEMLHLFAKNNPIYYNSYEQQVSGISCVVYEGDINQYWLNSIAQDSSRQPFSPTWILTAYIASLIAKDLGYEELIDIGSGDGRIAYCAKILDMQTHGIEIDDMLVDLQKTICDSTNINFNPNCAVAITFDYVSLKLKKPAFFIGGLAQMGGNILADSIIKQLDSKFKEKSGMVFVGSYSDKYSLGNTKHGGWGELIEKNNLKVTQTIILPTVWSFKDSKDSPYIFTEFN